MSVNPLLNGFNQEIIFLENIIRNIVNKYKFCHIKPWLSTWNDTKVSSDSYVQHLEFILDRVYILINVFLQYITHSKTCALNNSWIIVPPQKVSLGLSVKLLWTSIANLMDEQLSQQIQKMPTTSFLTINQTTQTEVVSMTTCDSCSSAMSCIKSLMNSFDEHRHKVQYQIFDITQFGCMLQVTTSIEQALTNLFVKLKEKEQEADSLNTDKENLQKSCNDKDRKIVFLEEEVRVFQLKVKKDEEDIFRLRQQEDKLKKINDLQDECIRNLRETLNQSENRYQRTIRDNQRLKAQNTSLEKGIKTCRKLLMDVPRTVNTKLETLDNELTVIEKFINQYDKSITNVNLRLTKMAKYFGKIEIKLENCTSRNDSEVFHKCQTLHKIILEKLTNKLNEKVESPPSLIKGNPIEDLSKQIEDNKNQIDLLNKENAKLAFLLDKFKRTNKK